MAYWRGPYLYRFKREGRRVVTEYLGRGEFAGIMATLEAEDQAERVEARAAIRAEREAQLRIDRQIDALGDLVRLVTRATMVASGYHTHKGQWRKQRHGGRE